MSMLRFSLGCPRSLTFHWSNPASSCLSTHGHSCVTTFWRRGTRLVGASKRDQINTPIKNNPHKKKIAKTIPIFFVHELKFYGDRIKRKPNENWLQSYIQFRTIRFLKYCRETPKLKVLGMGILLQAWSILLRKRMHRSWRWGCRHLTR